MEFVIEAVWAVCIVEVRFANALGSPLREVAISPRVSKMEGAFVIIEETFWST